LSLEDCHEIVKQALQVGNKNTFYTQSKKLGRHLKRDSAVLLSFRREEKIRALLDINKG